MCAATYKIYAVAYTRGKLPVDPKNSKGPWAQAMYHWSLFVETGREFEGDCYQLRGGPGNFDTWHQKGKTLTKSEHYRKRVLVGEVLQSKYAEFEGFVNAKATIDNTKAENDWSYNCQVWVTQAIIALQADQATSGYTPARVFNAATLKDELIEVESESSGEEF